MSAMTKIDLSTDPRLAECLQLIRGFAETLFKYVEQVTGKGLSRAALQVAEELEKVLRNRIEGIVTDHVAHAVDHMIAAHPQGASVGYTLRYPERRRHLLRLLACSFSELVATRDDGLRHLYPKVLFNGIESWAGKVLGGAVLGDVNQRALEALGLATSEDADDDRVIWLRLTSDQRISSFYYAVSIPLLMHFSYDFDRTRSDMQRVVSVATNNVIALTAEQWNLLFHRLFAPLFRRLSDHDEQARIDALFVEGTVVQAARIYAEYRRWLKVNHLSEPREEEFAPCAAARV